jgi:hypothetical protein
VERKKQTFFYSFQCTQCVSLFLFFISKYIRIEERILYFVFCSVLLFFVKFLQFFHIIYPKKNPHKFIQHVSSSLFIAHRCYCCRCFCCFRCYLTFNVLNQTRKKESDVEYNENEKKKKGKMMTMRS